MLQMLHLFCCNFAVGIRLFCQAGMVKGGVESASYGCDFLREVHAPESRAYGVVIVASAFGNFLWPQRGDAILEHRENVLSQG